MKNRSTGRLGRLFLNAVTLESRSPGPVVMKKRSTTDPGTLRAARHSRMTSFYNGQKPSIHLGGFTLIELLVVVLIIGILSAIALPQYRTAVIRARYVQLLVAANALADAEERYYLANGEYTSARENLDVQMPPSTDYTLIIDVRTNGHGAISAILSDGSLSYVRYFDHSTAEPRSRQCRVFQDKSYLHQVCKGLTGRYVGYPSSGEYVVYLFE